MKNMLKKTVALVLALALCLSFAGCYSENNTWAAKLGDDTMSIGGYIYAQAEDGVLTRLSLDSLRARTISEADICHTVTDGAGTVITVIIKSSETETK